MPVTEQKRRNDSTWVTQCPECKTAFRVTLQQLKVARGSVRCGNCLCAFKAMQHLVAAKQLPQELRPNVYNPQKPNPNKAPARKPAKTADPLYQPAARQTTPQDPLSPERSTPPSAQPIRGKGQSQPKPQTQAPTPTQAKTQPNGQAQAQAQPTPTSTPQAKPTQKAQATPKASSKPQAPVEPKAQPQTPAQNPTTQTQGQTQATPKTTASTQPKTPAKPQNRPDALPQESKQEQPVPKAKPHANGRPKPRAKPQSQKRKIPALPKFSNKSLLVGGAIASFGLFTLQYVYFNHHVENSVARKTALFTCRLAGCNIPALSDLEKIRINSVVVRNDPEYTNGLTIDAIITNTANFSQNYPSLLMVIQSANGDIIGTRQLTPEQYLAGEATGETNMIPGKPVHLSLKILKPQADAHRISFELTE